VYTFVFFDDCIHIFPNVTGQGGAKGNNTGSNYFKKILMTSRQAHITFILALQDPKGIATEVKANADCVWLFGGLPQSKVLSLFRQLPHMENAETNYAKYRKISKNDVMVFFFLSNNTMIRVIRTRFNNDSKKRNRNGARSVMIETEEFNNDNNNNNNINNNNQVSMNPNNLPINQIPMNPNNVPPPNQMLMNGGDGHHNN
jgi:hypothetical protein